MPLIHLETIDDCRLTWYRDLNRSNLSRRSGRFIVEGRLLLERLAVSDYPIESVVVDERYVEQVPPCVINQVPIYVIPGNQLSDIVGFGFHRGILACGIRQAAPTIDDVMSRPKVDQFTLVVCPHVVDPTNLGGIIRNCAAFGVDALVLGPGSADPFSRRSVRVSMGTALKLSIVESTVLADDLARLKSSYGFRLFATVVRSDATILPSAKRADRLAILFGGEGYGLDQQWIDSCDERVTLPMRLETDSLNLATAVGIFLYHFVELVLELNHGD